MPGYTDAAARAALDAIITTYPWLALYTTMPDDTGASGVEAAFTNYARVNTTGLWASAGSSAPATKANNATISFPNSGGTGAAIVGFGLITLVTSGVLGFADWLGNFAWKPATFSIATPSVVTCPAHGFANADTIVATGEYGSEGTLVAGWTPASPGLLTVASASTDTFTCGITNLAGTTGGLMVRKVTTQAVVSNMTIQFTSGQLVISLA